MDPDRTLPFCEICTQCGKSFSGPSTFTHHQRTCSKTKKRLGETLAKAKETWRAKKKCHIVSSQSDSVEVVGAMTVDSDTVITEDAVVMAVRLIYNANK
jgi:hypothetical protein